MHISSLFFIKKKFKNPTHNKSTYLIEIHSTYNILIELSPLGNVKWKLLQTKILTYKQIGIWSQIYGLRPHVEKRFLKANLNAARRKLFEFSCHNWKCLQTKLVGQTDGQRDRQRDRRTYSRAFHIFMWTLKINKNCIVPRNGTVNFIYLALKDTSIFKNALYSIWFKGFIWIITRDSTVFDYLKFSIRIKRNEYYIYFYQNCQSMNTLKICNYFRSYMKYYVWL